jgi:GntR family transcriptional regulator
VKGTVYLDIANAIRREILSQNLPAHSRLPSEPDLVMRHGVARATIRRALAALQDEGLIYSRQAVGTFVAEPRVQQDLDELCSFTEFMVYHGMKPQSRVISAETRTIDEPDSPVLRALGLARGSKVFFARRLRLGNGDPLVIANTWLPASIFPDFGNHDFKRESIYEIMARLGHKPMDAVQTIEGITLDPEDAELLGVAAGSAALLIRRTAYSNGIPVEYAVDLYRGDRTTFRVKLGVIEKRIEGKLSH